MKNILLPVFSLALLCGCSSFGSFQSVEKGKTSTEQVRSMLGEPDSRRFQAGGEVWEYQFVQGGMDRTRQQAVLNMSITFEDNAVSDYNLTASRLAARQADNTQQPTPTSRHAQHPGQPPQDQQRQQQPRPDQQRPRQPGDKVQESKFIKQFDKNNDGRVARDEFDGPDRLFEQFDRNKDGFIDKSEAPVGPPQQGQQGGQPRR